MNGQIDSSSVVIGIDVHKYSHAAVALDCFGQERGRHDFSNETLPSFTSWLATQGNRNDMLVALEDVNGYGVHLVSALAKMGFSMRYVPAILTERERKRSVHREKSDWLDAKRVAKVILTKYEETLPVPDSIADEREGYVAHSLDLLLCERRDLVETRTTLKNQLHALLHRYIGDSYAQGFPKAFTKKAIRYYRGMIKGKENPTTEKSALPQSILRRLDRLVLLGEQIAIIDKELEKTGKEAPMVTALTAGIHGCGILTASVIIAQLTTIRRFQTRAKLARYAGIAPTEKTSGIRGKFYTDQFGNRLLNRAIHTIALSQIACKGDPRGKLYYQKKLAEGKTKLWALRCLKRQLVNQVFKTLGEVR